MLQGRASRATIFRAACFQWLPDAMGQGLIVQREPGSGIGRTAKHPTHKNIRENKISASIEATALEPGLITSEDLFDILDHIPTGMAILSTDAEFRVLYINREFSRTFGYQKQELKTAWDWMQQAYADADLRQQKLASWLADVRQALQDGSPVPQRQAHARCKDGSHREVMLQTSLQRNLLLVTFTDITELKRLERELLGHEKKYRGFVENANDVIFTVDLQGCITYLSPNYQRNLGVDPADIVGKHFAELIHPSDLPNGMAAFASVLQGQRVTGVEYRIRQADGEWSWQAANLGPILDEDGRVAAVIGVGRDINLRKQAQAATEALNRALAAANEQLSRMANTDRLTGLWNRRHFEEVVAHEMIEADRYHLQLSMLIFDIDHFKAVNDQYGHLAGDQVLIELSRIARQQTRDSDLLARWGGEEFVILMPNTGPIDATTVAEKIRSAFASHRFPDLGTVTASFGIAAFRAQESLDRWISRADGALYEAKQAGRNRVQLASA